MGFFTSKISIFILVVTVVREPILIFWTFGFLIALNVANYLRQSRYSMPPPSSGVAKIGSDAGWLVVRQTDNYRVFIGSQNRRTELRWTSFVIFKSFAFAPFCNRFDIDTKFPVQRPVCSLLSLYFSSDSVLSRNATATYLSHNTSFYYRHFSVMVFYRAS